MELPHNFHKLSSQPHHLSSTTCERGNLFSTKIAGSKNVAKVWCFSRFFVIKILILYPISSKPGVSTLKPLFLNKRGRSYPRTDRYHPEWQWKGAALGQLSETEAPCGFKRNPQKRTVKAHDYSTGRPHSSFLCATHVLALASTCSRFLLVLTSNCAQTP